MKLDLDSLSQADLDAIEHAERTYDAIGEPIEDGDDDSPLASDYAGIVLCLALFAVLWCFAAALS